MGKFKHAVMGKQLIFGSQVFEWDTYQDGLINDKMGLMESAFRL
jgi:hypothetical protein